MLYLRVIRKEKNSQVNAHWVTSVPSLPSPWNEKALGKPGTWSLRFKGEETEAKELKAMLTSARVIAESCLLMRSEHAISQL